MTQNRYEETEFTEQPEPLFAVVLPLSVSESIGALPIAGLNAGLQKLEKALKVDNLVPPNMELVMVTVGDGETKTDLIGTNSFQPLNLAPNGRTPIGAAVHKSQEDAKMTTRFEETEFAENPEPRCAVVLALDVSGSMGGQPIAELNAGLLELDKDLKADKLASLRVELALVTFGGSVTKTDFIAADAFQPPTLTANGSTPMGAAVQKALDLLRDRKDTYKRNGLDYFRPWLFLITDGAPTDAWEGAAECARQEEERKGVSVYAIGVQDADMQILACFSAARPPLMLQGLAFRDLFQWLSKSLSAVAQSRPGRQVPLPSVGWGQTDTSV
jgi:uncharacterized protein YegL